MSGTEGRRTVSGVPVVTYDEIEAEHRARGVDVRDLAGSGSHFERWHRARGLPEHDEEGRHLRSSQIFFHRYREDPEGEAACPPYIDFWHELLHATESVPWQEEPGRRVKTVPLSPDIFPGVPTPTAEELAAGRARVEAAMGAPLTEEAWEELRRELTLRGPRADRAREIAAGIVERHGVDHPAVGRVVMVEMRVDC